MYPDLRFGTETKIIFFLSNSFEYSSIKPSFMLFKNLVKNFKSSLNFTLTLFIRLFRSVVRPRFLALCMLNKYVRFLGFLFSATTNSLSSRY